MKAATPVVLGPGRQHDIEDVGEVSLGFFRVVGGDHNRPEQAVLDDRESDHGGFELTHLQRKLDLTPVLLGSDTDELVRVGLGVLHREG